MGGFDILNQVAQSYSEAVMGESFSYTSPAGIVTSGLVGVFNQVNIDFQFTDFSSKKITTYTVISGKMQWGAVVPTDNGIVTDSSAGTYSVTTVAGSNSAGEPAFEITLKKLT